MSKPDDIPQDLWDHVERAVVPMGILGSDVGNRTVQNCCRAIMAAKAEEREACASICDIAAEHCLQARNQHPLLSKLRVSNHGAMTLAEDLAEVIRKRGEVNTAHKISETEV